MIETGDRIQPADREAMERARDRWNAVSKPKGSLGKLEDIVVRIAGAMRTENIDISRRVCVVFAADNGIVEEKISQSSQSLTAAVAMHIAGGCGNINTMAKASRCDVLTVDVGILPIYMPARPAAMIGLHVADGTRNFLKGPAMSEAEAEQAFLAGITMADRIARDGYQIAAVGEMGIGNTTTSAAVTAALCGLDPDAVTDRGGGLDDDGLARKRDVVWRGLLVHGLLKDSRPVDDREFAFNVLRCVGGLDIAAIAGFCTGCARRRIPVVLDGIITAAAALIAVRMEESVRDYLIASHLGREKGIKALLKELGLDPVLSADLALGEGTGAVLLFPVLDVAVAEYRSALTFEQMGFATDYDADDGIRVFTNK